MIDWWFRNRRTGEITIAQFPNVALWIFLAAVVVRALLPSGRLHTPLDVVVLAALAWWAIDELVRGANPWRRLLGGLGCVVVVSGVLAYVR